ncbi:MULTISPECIES: hypothetical protein [unclassified Aureimonas]|uniref:hypothetical protein n=1 Tax=unclassified Aureimonas TaxID=2615206 RepID=UPI0006F4BB16|nr:MULTISPECIES: hypothetical protein [unclassified Aureimonas]KQT64175.1 hypothetical protein ASG62_04065 [Aureimonas sp. Leaf427]KQT81364.1 hypothetical protein ASG54_01335 [Aureimonas sp. Leaf460]
MSPLHTQDDRDRTEQAARYLIEQHGENAIAEAEAAIRHATELNDQSAIEALTDILSLLRETRLT